jgi:hypothetical protein
MISPPETVDLQIVGERQGIGKRLASVGERPRSACGEKATAHRMRRFRLSGCHPYGGCAQAYRLQQSRHNRCVIDRQKRGEDPMFLDPTVAKKYPNPNAKQRHWSINREVNQTMVLGLINQDHCPDHSYSADGQ